MDSSFKEKFQRNVTLHWIRALWLATQKLSTNQSHLNLRSVILRSFFLYRIWPWIPDDPIEDNTFLGDRDRKGPKNGY